MSVAVCSATDIFRDSIFVQITESLCNNIVVKNMPSVCRDEVVDIRPYVYVNGHAATVAELADMTFWNKSDVITQTNTSILDPAAIDMSTMWNSTNLFPRIEIAYQPNVTLGTCTPYLYSPDTKVPSKFIFTNTILTHDNYGGSRNYTVEGTYYGFNDIFHKDVLTKLYVDNFNVFAGTQLNVYTDALHQNIVTGNDLAPGDYYVQAVNPACANDKTDFTIQVENSDEQMVWQGAPNIGKGYYTFQVTSYTGANYAWFVWGGSIVAGLNTNQITVYFSENAAPAVTVSCEITFPAIRTTADATIHSAVYLDRTGNNGTLEEIKPSLTTPVKDNMILTGVAIYPNPANAEFVVSGEGNYALTVYNTLGEQIYTDKNYSANTPLSVSSKGLHLIHLEQNGKRQVLKVVLQ